MTWKRFLAVAGVSTLLLSLTACDSGGPGAEPTDPPVPGPALSCGTVTEFAADRAAVVGDSMSVSLDLVVRAGLTYELSAPYFGVGVRDNNLLLTPTAPGIRSIVVHGLKRCGSGADAPLERVARITVLVAARASGLTCTRPETNPPPSVVLAVGGVPTMQPLIGADGLFSGNFMMPGSLISATVSEPVVRVSPAGESLWIDPQVAVGSGVVFVEAMDLCAQRVSAAVPVSVVDSPTCSADYDPSDADYLPLAVGLRWRYATHWSWYDNWHGTSGSGNGEETWEVVTEGACTDGARTYGVSVTGAGAPATMTITVQGDSVTVGHPSVSGTVRRRYPSPAPDSVRISGGSGYGAPATSWTLRRGAGISSMGRSYTTHMQGDSYSVRLIEGPMAGPAGGGRRVTRR